MAFKLAAIVPHPPILIPGIGKENLLRLEKTRNIYNQIEEEIRAEKIDTIIIISSHGPIRPAVFGINISTEFEINFEEFGDFSTKMSINGDSELAQNIREFLIEKPEVQAISQPVLDHGCGVPLYSLLFNYFDKNSSGGLGKNIEIVPIYASNAGLKEHFELGKLIRGQIEKGRKKIAILASGDLSHTVTKNSPAGYSARGAKFDQRLIECLQEKKIEDILNFDDSLIAEVKPCGLKAIAMLLGALNGTGYDILSTSYEPPFGVGHLTMLLKPLPN
jgi:aromatic ring-opening dioxygenase LigB subunit